MSTATNESSPLLPCDDAPSEQSSNSPTNKTVGYLAACVSLLTAACTFTLIRLAAHTFMLPPSTILLLRGLMLCSIAGGYMLATVGVCGSFAMPRKTALLLLVRGAFGGVVYLLLINSIALLSAGDSATYKATYLVFTSVMSAVFLREGLTKRELVAFVLSFIGAVIVTRSVADSPEKQELGAIYGLSSAALMSASTTAMRGMGKSAHVMWPVVSLGLFSAVIGGLAGGTDTLLHLSEVQKTGVFVMILSGVVAFIGQAAFSVALRNCKVGPVAMIECIDVPVTYVFGILFLHEVPTLMRMLGAVFMVCAVVLVASSGIQQK